MPTIIRTKKPIDLEISTKYETLKFLCIHSKACYILSDIVFNIPKYMNSNIHIHLGQYDTFKGRSYYSYALYCLLNEQTAFPQCFRPNDIAYLTTFLLMVDLDRVQ